MAVKGAREVTVNIGGGLYSVNTSLSEEELSRVRGLIDEAYGEVNKGVRQEDALVITVLRLAYSLDAVSEKLKVLAAGLK